MSLDARSPRMSAAARFTLAASAALTLCSMPAHGAATPAGPQNDAALRQTQLHQATAAAARDLATFAQRYLQNGAGSMPPHFPLAVTDVKELGHARIGYGFQVYTLDPADVIAGRSDVGRMARPTGDWRFVIDVNGRPIGLATVRQERGQWETVSYGGAALAREIATVAARHGNASRSNLRFIRVFQAQSDFIEVTSDADFRVRFAPLQSARQSLALRQYSPSVNGSADSLIDAGDFLDPMRNAIKANLATFR